MADHNAVKFETEPNDRATGASRDQALERIVKALDDPLSVGDAG